MKDTSKFQGVLVEPSLQSKKRFYGPLTCLSSDFSVKGYHSDDDYILLGRNEKFEGNICYKPKRYCKKQKNENCESQKYADEEPSDPHVSEEYILLGSNIRFSVNTIYHPRVCWHYYPNSDNVKYLMQLENIEKNSTNGKVPVDCHGGSSTNDEDYILLGNQAKFSENVVYKQRKRWNNTPSKSGETECDLNENCESQKYADEEPSDPHMQLENIEKNSTNGKVPVDCHGGSSTNDEDYILLGNQAKFSENVVYKQRKRWNNTPSKSGETERDLEENGDQYPATRKDLKPAPIIDTGKFTESSHAIKLDNSKTNKLIKEFADKSNVNIMNDCADKENTEVESEEIVNPARSPVKKSVMFECSSPLKHSNNKEKLLGLLYKSGLNLPRNSPLMSSEYQNNFTVKKPLKTDSLVSKSKKHFHSGTYFEQAPSQNNYPVKKSEYQRNFCVSLSDKNVNTSAVENKDSCLKKPKHPRRSKSVNSKRTQRIGTLAKSVPTEDVYPRMRKSSQPSKNTKSLSTNLESTKSETSAPTASKEAEDCDRTWMKHRMKKSKSFECITSQPELKDKGPVTPVLSEYQKNFNSPSSFAYVKNSWVTKDPQVTTENQSYQDWYKQVLELREEAAEYRHRSFDSHFCSKHMVQLISKETEIWEKPKKSSNMSIDPSLMKPAGISYFQPNNYSIITNNLINSPSANNECKIELEVVDETSVPDTDGSKLARDHHHHHHRYEDVIDRECSKDVGKTSKSKTVSNEEQDHNLDENNQNESVNENGETFEACVVESITEMIRKDDPRCLNTANSGSMKTNDPQTLTGNNSELLFKSQPAAFTRQDSDDGVVDNIEEGDEEVRSYLRNAAPSTGSKDFYRTTLDPSKTVTTSKDKRCRSDADKRAYHLELASKVSENFRKPKQFFKSCDSMFTKTPAFSKPSRNIPVIQRQPTLPNSKPPKKFHDAFLSTNKPIIYTRENKSSKNSCMKRIKPLNSQENIPIKTFARSNMTNGLQPHYEHMSDTYNALPHSNYDPHSHESASSERSICESLDSSSSLISDVLERTRKRMNFW